MEPQSDQPEQTPINNAAQPDTVPSTNAPAEAPAPTNDSIAPDQPAAAPSPSPASSPSVTGDSEEPATTPDTASTPSPVQPMADGTGQVVTGSSKKGGRKKLFGLLAVVIVVLLAGGYAFGIYMPNSPSHVFSSSLTNSGKALDRLVSYTKQQDTASYKSLSYNGTLHIKNPSVSGDVTLSGASTKDADGTLNLNADIMGAKIQVVGRSIKVPGSTSPDLYLQVTGVKKYLDSFGMSSLDNLDGQWIVIDHTLLDSYASKASGNSQSSNSSITVPTTAEVNDAITKVQTVNKQYIFTTNASTAVLTNKKFVGKETKGGRSVDHYKVGYNKAHLQAYVTALGQALDSSQLNNWSKKANNGKNLSQEVNISSLKNSINNANAGYSFDLWADTKTKLVDSVTFTDPKDSSSTFTISQGYTGGSSYPFGFSATGKGSDGTTQNGSLKLTVDTSNKDYTGSLNFVSGSTTVTGNFKLAPSNKVIHVTAPAGAKSITDVLSGLGFGPTDTSGTSSVNALQL